MRKLGCSTGRREAVVSPRIACFDAPLRQVAAVRIADSMKSSRREKIRIHENRTLSEAD